MTKPKALRPGSVIRLVSPASPMTPEKTQPFAKMMEEAGYGVELSDHVFEVDYYLAGADRDRAADLQKAFDDPNVNAVMCTRGGYGCARLMPYLDLDRMAASGKMFLGFSDITTLHIALNRRGLATVHAPMALTFTVEREPWVRESFLATVRGENPIPSTAAKGTTLTGGKAQGVVTGGCLCLLTDSIGTPDPLDCRGKILLVEDVDEHPHRIDAMLTHLRLSGLIQQAAGIVIGEMTRTDEKADESIGSRPWREIVRDRLSGLDVPTIIDFPFGHCKNMLTLPLGIRAEIDADAGTLTYTESLCA
ncbi:MAG TPA: LD-carboxypeptidase [Fimbriimonadaceae bacterium]|nr:LD-carboxypeptidase [Fimbriimonadaceae bacterium]